MTENQSSRDLNELELYSVVGNEVWKRAVHSWGGSLGIIKHPDNSLIASSSTCDFYLMVKDGSSDSGLHIYSPVRTMGEGMK